jgi:hypothetical protein
MRTAEASARAPEAVAPAVSLADDPFVADLPGLAAAAGVFSAVAGESPAVDALGEVETALRLRFRKEGRADVSTIFARRISIRVDAPPRRLLEAILDVEAEKAALEADEAEDLGAPAPGARTMRVALLRMGQRPFQADYRWAFTARSSPRADGSLVVRYDLKPDSKTERVSLFSGVGTLIPDGDGTRWVEAFAVGSPSSVPFFLKGKARAELDKVLARRARNLATACRAPK